MIEKISIIEGYVNHLEEVVYGCECAICNAQEDGTYLDGLNQVLTILKK